MKEPKVPDSSLSSEILKLTDKLAKDPKSKLFVPLAEEYIKSRMLDEAAMILTDGLKIHPHFSTARVALGKVYLEKGQIKEAKAEFEQVITANPDNLFAHRKLARIYKDEGELTRARSSCQAVLSLNPKDSEMKALIEELGRLSEKPVEIPVTRSEVLKVPETVQQPEAVEEAVPASPPAEEVSAAAFGQETAEIQEEPLAPSAPVKPYGEGVGSPISAGEPEERAGETPMDLAPAAEPIPVEPAPAAAEAEAGEEILTEALADLYIKQGYYDKGLEVYRKLISQDPPNMALQRKLEETEVLVKLLTESPKVRPRSHEAVVSEPSDSIPAVAAASSSPTTPEEVMSSSGESVSGIGSQPAPEAAGAITGESSSEEDEKIKRLEAWLDSIRKGRTQ